MPGQAILDLPVINLEVYLDQPQRLHAQCIEDYGLTGLAPHADAVFHFAASLWRYATGQSAAQVAGLSAFYLRALSGFVAARRAREAASGRAAARRAAEDLENARHELDDLTRLCTDLVSELLMRARRNRGSARRKVEENLQRLGDPAWARELDRLARAMIAAPVFDVDFSGSLEEVLPQLEHLVQPANGSGRHAAQPMDAQLLERMQRELREYQAIANQASVRLKQIDRERRDLEAILAETTRGEASPVVRDDRDDVEMLVQRAKDSGRNARSEEGRELEQLRAENKQLRADAERLSTELLTALAQATDGESQAEELLDRIEEVNSQRLEAAAAIEQLSTRLGRVQTEAAGTVLLRARITELEAIVHGLRNELSAANNRITGAEAAARLLQDAAGRSAEIEKILSQSEARLAEAEGRLLEAEGRVEHLSAQLQDRDYRIGQMEQRATAAKRSVDTLSGQLAESETLASEQAARIRELDREADRLRREASQARGQAEEAAERTRAAHTELERAQNELKAERARYEKTRAETGRVVDEMKLARTRADKAEAETNNLRHSAEKAAAAADENQRKAREAENLLARTSAELAELRKQLSASESSSRQANVAATTQLAAAQSELERVNAELEALRRSESTQGDAAARLRAELAMSQTQLAQTREQSASSLDLLNEKLQQADDKLALAAERGRNAEAERKALAQALDSSEKSRQDQQRQQQSDKDRIGQDARTVAAQTARIREEAAALKSRLDEADAFLISRERELENTSTRLAKVLENIARIADLRAEFDNAKDAATRDASAASISRKLDSLFLEAGKPAAKGKHTKRILVRPTAPVDKDETGKEPADPKRETASRRKRPEAKS